MRGEWAVRGRKVIPDTLVQLTKCVLEKNLFFYHVSLTGEFQNEVFIFEPLQL